MLVSDIKGIQMTNLTLGNFPNLPEKATEFNFSLDAGMCEGFNQAKAIYDGLNVSLDVEELAKLIYENDMGNMPWEKAGALSRQGCRKIAQVISQSAARVMRVTR